MIQDQLHVVYARAGGLDVHKMEITAAIRCCRHEAEPPKAETRSFSALPPGLQELVEWLQQHRVEAVAMEGTGVYWQTVFDAVSAVGIDCQLHHAQQIKQLRGRKTDINDARWLARICQFGLGTPSYVPTQAFREFRALSRLRRKMVEDRARYRNRIHQLIDQAGVRVGGILTDIFGYNGQLILQGLVVQQSVDQILDSLTGHVSPKLQHLAQALAAKLSDTQCWMLQELLQQHHNLDGSIARIEQQLQQHLEPYEAQLQLLRTIPGINHRAALSLVAEIGPNLDAFANAQRFAAWTGTTPGNHESAGKRRTTRVRRGNRNLTQTLIECAHAAARTKHCQFQHFHRGLLIRRGYKRAIVATAHKLARTIYAVLQTQTPYRDNQVDYSKIVAQRNAPRWIRELTHFDILKQQDDGTFVINWP